MLRIRMFGLRTSAMLLIAAGSLSAGTPLGTSVTYQGRLERNGAPVDDRCDFKFELYEDARATMQVGGTQSVSAVKIVNGVFTVELNAGGEFGPNPFNGDERWLLISVLCPPDAGFTPLMPLQKLTAAPYAHFALNTAGGGSGFWNANGAHIYNTNAGRVGIGTNSPTRDLEVNMSVDGVVHGGVRNSSTGTSAQALVAVNADDAQGSLTAYSSNYVSPTFRDRIALTSATNSTGLLLAATALTGDICFYTGGAASGNRRMTIAPDGNVGIGIDAPAWPLHVQTAGARAIQGHAAPISGVPVGVFGITGTFTAQPTTATGVFGGTAAGNGVFGLSGSGTGVRGIASNNSGTNYGVYGQSFSAEGYAGYFIGGRNYFEGSVGIGTTAPDEDLHIHAPAGDVALRMTSGGSWPLILKHNDASVFTIENGGQERLTLTAGGNVGIGTTALGGKLQVDVDGAGTGNPAIRANNTNAGGIGVFSTTNSTDANLVLTNSGSGDLIRGFNNSGLKFRVTNDGTAVCTVLQVTGADLAEKFPVTEKVEPGTVVAIDAERPGRLRVARGAYNRRVAGVVSGANGLSAGTVLGNLPGHEDAPPIALTGRVWCRCDASNGPIEPGDLLTTSDTPGHAMKVTDFQKAQGAILGKAMSSLTEGEGLVLILVTLQ